MSEKACHLALSARLDTLAVPVARENTPYTPTPGTAWVRERCTFNGRAAATLGPSGYDRLTGVYFVDVFAPRGVGWGAGRTTADLVHAAFARGTVLTSGSVRVVVERCYSTAPREEPDWWMVPVTVIFRSDVAP